MSAPVFGAKTLRGLVDRFLEALFVRGVSKWTVKSRRHLLLRFIDWCEERSLSRPEEITRSVLERYQRFLFHMRKADGRPLSFGTQYNGLSALRVFFRWLYKQELSLIDPAADLVLPKLDKRLPEHVLTKEEAEQVLNAVDIQTAFGIEERAILETLYSTAIRRAELCGLSLYDVDLEHGLVRVRKGKGNKDRMVPIGRRAVAWIEKYLEDVRPVFVRKDPAELALFMTKTGFPMYPGLLSALVSEAIRRSGIDKTGSCHTFRHTAATLMLENGADIRMIQEMLGHNQVTTTQLYTKVSIVKLKEVHERTHPARLSRKEEPGEEKEPSA